MVDQATGLQVGATEIVADRTAASQIFDNHDGTFTGQFFTEPVFYQPTEGSSWAPIEVGFTAPDSAGVAVSDKAPVTVSVAGSTTSTFLSLTKDRQTVAFQLPADLLNKVIAVKPTTAGPVADYKDFLPGVDLRVIADSRGAKSFFIWNAPPTETTLRYVVDAPGLTLVAQKDGSIVLVDKAGTTVAAIPRPYAVDSNADVHAGGGRYTDLVSLSLGDDGKTVTVSVDPTWLKSAVYPVFVDPSTGWVNNAGSSSYGDTFSASAYPSSNYANYARPDYPYYHEMWNGTDPSGTSGQSMDFLRWDLSALANTTIDIASMVLLPYHQYYPTAGETTYARPVASAWTEAGLTYANQPNHLYPVVSASCTEGHNCAFDVLGIVQPWTKGIAPTANYGFTVDTINLNSTYWKRFIASEDANVNKPRLLVSYHNIAAPTTTTPRLTGAISWTPAVAQTAFHVDIATSSAFGATIVGNSGDMAGAATSWLIPSSIPLVDDGLYWYRVKTYDGNSWSPYTTASFTYDAYQRGDESYFTQVPFDLGGGWNLAIGAHNGAATLSRSLFSIPSFGPAASLDFTYSSAGPTTAGMFGAGWSSNLTQYLSFENGLIVWHRADGGRVAFPATSRPSPPARPM